MKPIRFIEDIAEQIQPPSGGCVLKQKLKIGDITDDFQPPSGGCVLKLFSILKRDDIRKPAAFGRLCVETTFCGPS